MLRFFLAGLATVGGVVMLFLVSSGDLPGAWQSLEHTVVVPHHQSAADTASVTPAWHAVAAVNSQPQPKPQPDPQPQQQALQAEIQALQAKLLAATQAVGDLQKQTQQQHQQLAQLQQQHSLDESQVVKLKQQQAAAAAAVAQAKAQQQAAAQQVQQAKAQAEKEAEQQAKAQAQQQAEQQAKAQAEKEAQQQAKAQAQQQAEQQAKAQAQQQAEQQAKAQAQQQAEQQAKAQAQQQAEQQARAKAKEEADRQAQLAKVRQERARQQAVAQQSDAAAKLHPEGHKPISLALSSTSPRLGTQPGTTSRAVANPEPSASPSREPHKPAVRRDADSLSAVLARLHRQVAPHREARPAPQPPPVRPVEATRNPPPSTPSHERLARARDAIRQGRLQEAQQLLEEAQLQLVFRPVSPDGEAGNSGSEAATDVAQALSMLGAGRGDAALHYVDRAMAAGGARPQQASVASPQYWSPQAAPAREWPSRGYPRD